MGLAAWVVLVLGGRRRAVVGAGWRRKEEKQQIPRTWLVGPPRPSSHFHSVGATLADGTGHSGWQDYDGVPLARWRTSPIVWCALTATLSLHLVRRGQDVGWQGAEARW